MPDLRFLSEAAFFIGCGVGGLPLAVLGYVLGMQHPRFPIVAYGRNWYKEVGWKTGQSTKSQPMSFESGRSRTPEGQQTPSRLLRSQTGTGRDGTRVSGTSKASAVRLNRRQKINLCALILNSPASDSGLPREDVPLTLAALKRHGIGRKAADRIREDIVRLRLGWKDDAGIVYLDRHKAREFVARARRAGVIGG